MHPHYRAGYHQAVVDLAAMTTTDTRAEARAALAAWDESGSYEAVIYGDDTKALKLAAALRALLDEHDALVREMHQRELHHFEVEKLLTEAGINPDEPVSTEDIRETLAAVLSIYWHGNGGGKPWEADYKQADAILARFHVTPKSDMLEKTPAPNERKHQ
jgi:hypothetical protein